MTDCSSIHGSSTSSSDMNSHHGAMSKIRTVRLIRPHTGNRNNLTLGHPPFSSYGFSLRGGREFGTGFFVSSVVKGSEADLKGMQIGDQIIRVGSTTGSYRVDDAVHKELSQFIMNQDRLTLKVRGELSNWNVSITIFVKLFLRPITSAGDWEILGILMYFITFLSLQNHDKWAERKISFGLWLFHYCSIVNKWLIQCNNASQFTCNGYFVH